MYSMHKEEEAGGGGNGKSVGLGINRMFASREPARKIADNYLPIFVKRSRENQLKNKNKVCYYKKKKSLAEPSILLYWQDEM